jgi:opacity protein-like surface antigen
MRLAVLTALITLAATTAFAQDAATTTAWINAPGYITGMGGLARTPGSTTGDFLVEGGVRVAPHVMVLGDLGQFHNLTVDLQPTLAGTTAALAANQGLTVVGGGTLPALYALGGTRLEIPIDRRVLPYVLGAVGVARLAPSPRFAFESGTMPDGSTPAAGQDVTSAMAIAGVYTAPPSSTAFMFSLGAGAQVLVAPHWVLDGGYRFARIAADSTLSAAPLNGNCLTLGVGYRF